MKKQISTFFLILIHSLTNAQENKIPSIKFDDISFQGTGIISNDYHASINDFYLLCPESKLLNRDFTGFSEYDNSHEYYNDYFNDYYYYNHRREQGSGSASMLAGISFADKNKQSYRKNFHMRIGITYQSGINFSYSTIKESSAPYDTLTSNSGSILYLDSVFTESYYMKYHYEEFKLDVTALYYLNPDSRWLLYTGLGIAAGTSLNNYTTIEYDTYANIRSGNSNNADPYYSTTTKENKSETIYNKGGFVYAISTPLGIDFKISKENIFWKRIHFYYEMRPGINYINIQELRSYTKTYFQSSFGLRITTS